jgi:hypothetical protein
LFLVLVLVLVLVLCSGGQLFGCMLQNRACQNRLPGLVCVVRKDRLAGRFLFQPSPPLLCSTLAN